MSTVSRLKEYLEYKGISTSGAEKTCGFGNATLRNAFEKDNASIGSERLEIILKSYPDLSAEWLLRGTGSMIIGEGKAVELEKKISAMSSRQDKKDAAYDILLGMFDVMSKTYDFYREK